MALADPQTVTINTVAQTLNQVEVDRQRTLYQKADETVKLTVSHQQSGQRTRRMIRLEQRVLATNPLTSQQDYRTAVAYIVIEQPEYGFSITELGYLVTALCGWCTTGTNTTKVLEGQH